MPYRLWATLAFFVIGFVTTSKLARADEPTAADGSIEARSAPEEVVTVRAAPRDPGRTTLRADELRQIPGAFGDPLRAVEALPGMTPVVSGLPFFFVRGSPPGNTGYFVDGVRVPLLHHIGVGPSVIAPALVDRIDVYAGGYPARFGRFAGGIVSAETRRPADHAAGEANVRLFDASAFAETPVADGKGTVLVAGRYSFAGLALGLVAPDVRLRYWDYQARATWELTRDDRIGVFAFGSDDYLGNADSGSSNTKTLFATQFHRVDLRWDHAVGATGQMRTAATLGHDETSTDALKGVRATMARVRTELDVPVNDAVRVHAGSDVMLEHRTLAPGYDAAPERTGRSTYPPRNDLTLGVYADLSWAVAPRVLLVPGMRADVYGSMLSERPPPEDPARRRGASLGIDPRIAARVQANHDVALLATFGLSHQPPAVAAQTPGLSSGSLADGLQTSIQTSLGAEIYLPAGITVAPTLFEHESRGMTDLSATCSDNPRSYPDLDKQVDVAQCAAARVSGRTYGLELLARRSLTKRLTGLVAYTLSRTTRDVPPSDEGLWRMGSPPPTGSIVGAFDRTHVLNIIGAYDLGSGFRVGARFLYYTGRPYSDSLHYVPVPPYNNRRLPDFYRIDLRAEKRWRLGETGHISVVLEGLNATLRKEAISVACDDPNGPALEGRTRLDTCVPYRLGPIAIPSIGVEGAI